MVPFLIVFLGLVLVVFPIWAIIRIFALGRENNALAEHLSEIESQLRALRDASRAQPGADVAPPVPAASPAEAPRDITPVAVPPPPIVTSPAAPAPAPPPVAAPPVVTAPWIPDEPQSPEPRINWEQFTGAKLLAWTGGLLAFLAAAFFIKYSFERDLIPPAVRAAIGYAFGLALIGGGLRIRRDRYATTVHTLCATGIVSLYAVTFACNSIYHFEHFGPGATFAWMSLITAAAFFLAVRLGARPVALLGMLGGFLTPALLSTGHDNAVGLFSYIALLDLGLIAVALHRRWHFLVPLGAAGTIVTQIAWAQKFLSAGTATTAMVVCLLFSALFGAAYFANRGIARRRGDDIAVPPEILWPAIALPFVGFVFASAFLGYPAIAARPVLLFSFVFAADLVLLVLACTDARLPKLHLVAGLAVFALLAVWTGFRLTTQLLPWALGLYVAHAVLHTAFPIALQRRWPAAEPTWWSQLFPPLTLLLMLAPVLKLDGVSLGIWPAVLLIDFLAIGLALVSGSLVAVGLVLAATLVVTAAWLLRMPANLESQPAVLLIIAGFAALFYGAGLFLARRLAAPDERAAALPNLFGDRRAQLPAFAALLPFALLILVSGRLPLANPAAIFAVALLLVVLVLALAAILIRPGAANDGDAAKVSWLPACALAGLAALEYAWHERHFAPANARGVLPWYLGFHAIFAMFPFLFRSRMSEMTGPWAIGALAGVAQFPLVYWLVRDAWPNDFMGLLPAGFALVPLASLAALRADAAETPARLNQLAWFAGVALLFITLIFPIQFERQWLTLAWALEGVALLWLFHRIPHRGLRGTGIVLLVVAFARLALNPFVLEYHARGGAPIFNWYLYTYGITTACLLVGAGLLRSREVSERVPGLNARALLITLGTILGFLLVNIEIADFFSPPGARVLTFQFSGNFARDMTYTIAWALFALGLLLMSIWKQVRAGRYAALGLLGVTVLKLFFHDLARLEALYRIGALLAVAVIAIVASFAYQRFLPGNEKDAR